MFSGILPDVVESSASPALSPDVESDSPDLAPEIVQSTSPDVVEWGILKEIQLELLSLQSPELERLCH
jgi:hypothetical protein